MHLIRRLVSTRPFTPGIWLLGASIVSIIVAASLAMALRPAVAQMEFDYNGDGKVTCADFEQQFPETFTDEATKALQQYPDALKRLNANSGENGIACEGQPASAAPANDEATPTPESPAPALTPAAPEPNPMASAGVPADVMARVEGCVVIAISSRDVAGAGCPGVGVVTFRIPDDAPSMRDEAIINPRAALPVAPAPPAAPVAAPRGTRTDSGQNDQANTTNDRGNATAGKSTRDNSAGSGTGNSDNAAGSGKGNQNNSTANGKGKQNNSNDSGKTTEKTKMGKHKSEKGGKNKHKHKNKKKNANAHGKHGKHGKQDKKNQKKGNQ